MKFAACAKLKQPRYARVCLLFIYVYVFTLYARSYTIASACWQNTKHGKTYIYVWLYVSGKLLLGYCGETRQIEHTLNDAIGIAIVAQILYSGWAKDAILAVHFKAFLASQRKT